MTDTLFLFALWCNLFTVSNLICSFWNTNTVSRIWSNVKNRNKTIRLTSLTSYWDVHINNVMTEKKTYMFWQLFNLVITEIETRTHQQCHWSCHSLLPFSTNHTIDKWYWDGVLRARLSRLWTRCVAQGTLTVKRINHLFLPIGTIFPMFL